MNSLILNLLRFWEAYGAMACTLLGLLGLLWCFLRWYWVEQEQPLDLLRNRFHWLTRWMLLHRRSAKTLPISAVLLVLGLGMSWALRSDAFQQGVFLNGPFFLGAHVVLAILVLAVWSTWDREPKFLKSGEGRANTRFRDTPEEWGIRVVDGKNAHIDPQPTAELLVHRSPSRLACRILMDGQHRGG